MSLHRCIKPCALLFFAFIVFLLSVSPTVSAQEPAFKLEVGNVFARPGEQVKVPIYLSNFPDTVVAFYYVIVMDWSGLATFAIDSSGTVRGVQVDTVGTLASGWGLTHTNGGIVAEVSGFANTGGGQNSAGILAPQEGGTLLYMLVDVPEDPDTAAGNKIGLRVDPRFYAPQLTDPRGNLLGYHYVQYVDTSYYYCTQWADDVCMNWQQVSTPPYDSMMVELDSTNVIDTTAFEIIDGSITVNFCGYNGQGPDIVELTGIVDHLFGGDDIAPPLDVADCDCSCAIDIIDLTTAVDYLFDGIPLPICLR